DVLGAEGRCGGRGRRGHGRELTGGLFARRPLLGVVILERSLLGGARSGVAGVRLRRMILIACPPVPWPPRGPKTDASHPGDPDPGPSQRNRSWFLVPGVDLDRPRASIRPDGAGPARASGCLQR